MAPDEGFLFGFEAVRYIKQMQTIVVFLTSRLQLIARCGMSGPAEVKFIRQFVAESKEALREHFLGDRERCEEKIVSRIAKELGAKGRDKECIRQLFSLASRDLVFPGERE